MRGMTGKRRQGKKEGKGRGQAQLFFDISLTGYASFCLLLNISFISQGAVKYFTKGNIKKDQKGSFWNENERDQWKGFFVQIPCFIVHHFILL